jgi:integral membrane sensor domain MASE1
MALSAIGPVGRVATAVTNPGLRTYMVALVVAASYYAGCQIGFFLTPTGTPIATFWPPNAILLAVFLLVPQRIWWVLVLAVLPAHLLVQLRAGIPVLLALGWFVGNIGEALLGAASISFFRREKPLFESAHGMTVFLVFGVLLATLLTSFVDAGSAFLTGSGRDYWTLWTARLTSNVVADLTIVPTIVGIAIGRSRFARASVALYFEAAILSLAVLFVGLLVFGGTISSFSLLAYLPLPLLLWAALRFGVGGVSASMLVVALISIWNAMRGEGLFGAFPITERILHIHILLILLAVPLMFVAAEFAERRRSERALVNAHTNLLCTQERRIYRLAREIHENVLQRLTLAGLTMDEVRASNASVSFDKLYDQISETSEVALTLSHELYAFTVEYMGLERALRKLCRDISMKTGVTLNFSSENVLSLPPEVSHPLFRVTQVALQAVAQNSGSQTATVEFEVTEGRVLLRIMYDESKMGVEIGRSAGLDCIREQVVSLNGTLKIASASAIPSRMILEASIPVVRYGVEDNPG